MHFLTCVCNSQMINGHCRTPRNTSDFCLEVCQSWLFFILRATGLIFPQGIFEGGTLWFLHTQERVCPLAGGRVGRKSWASPASPLPLSHLCLPTVGCTAVCPEWGYLLWQGGGHDWDGLQAVLGGCTPKAQLPTGFVSNGAPFAFCLLFLSYSSWEGNCGLWLGGSRHPGTCDEHYFSRLFGALHA